MANASTPSGGTAGEICEACPCTPPPWFHLPPKEKSGEFNCAGLAFRSYQPVPTLEQTIAEIKNKGASEIKCDEPLKPCSIKYKVWKYEVYVKEFLSNGKQVSGTASKYLKTLAGGPDFHIVSGLLDRNGEEDPNVYSKYGLGNPVKGPGMYDDFIPGKELPELMKNAFQGKRDKFYGGYVTDETAEGYFSKIPSDAMIQPVFGGKAHNEWWPLDHFEEQLRSYANHLGRPDLKPGYTRIELIYSIEWVKCYGEK